jgi:regulation of enolase protein 1 (concanavalin A-like superfamily)
MCKGFMILGNKITILILLAALCIWSCKPQNSDPSQNPDNTNRLNMSKINSEDLADFEWINEPAQFEVDKGTLRIIAKKGTDFFNNPEDGSITASAPMLYQNIDGDFVATALVRPDFSSLWNAVSLMVHIDQNHWIKLAFENSDATGKSIVSVVTKNTSDDANGVMLHDHDSVWLRMIRKGDIYSLLWSVDGEDYKMARLSAMPHTTTVKVGIEAQTPVGNSTTHEIHYFDIVKTTVKDMRKGK